MMHNTHVYATDSTVWNPPSTISLISRAVKPATPCIPLIFPRTLLQTDGRNAWHSPQELKAVLGLQDLADRHHHILAVAVPYLQSY